MYRVCLGGAIRFKLTWYDYTIVHIHVYRSSTELMLDQWFIPGLSTLILCAHIFALLFLAVVYLYICDRICENPLNNVLRILSMNTCKFTAINIGSSDYCVTKCCSSLMVEL